MEKRSYMMFANIDNKKKESNKKPHLIQKLPVDITSYENQENYWDALDQWKKHTVSGEIVEERNHRSSTHKPKFLKGPLEVAYSREEGDEEIMNDYFNNIINDIKNDNARLRDDFKEREDRYYKEIQQSKQEAKEREERTSSYLKEREERILSDAKDRERRFQQELLKAYNDNKEREERIIKAIEKSEMLMSEKVEKSGSLTNEKIKEIKESINRSEDNISSAKKHIQALTISITIGIFAVIVAMIIGAFTLLPSDNDSGKTTENQNTLQKPIENNSNESINQN